ncbi:MAG TPA: amino acid-binding protein [Anaeromyxobacteraceae bacterium]|jgi:hypothetical protein
MLQQLSLFLENRPGQLRAPCQALAAAGIDILTLSLADTAQFGILRLIVRDPARAREVLEAAGMVVNATEVVAVEVEDRPGGLAAVLEHVEGAGLSVEYMYAFAVSPGAGKAALVFRFERQGEALELLRKRGARLLGPEELLALRG